MNHIYVLTHEANNNTWQKFYKNKKDALSAFNQLKKEYSEEKIELVESYTSLTNDFHGIFITVSREEVK